KLYHTSFAPCCRSAHHPDTHSFPTRRSSDLVAAAGEDFLVDAELAELVDNERNALALSVGEQVADQRGLAGPEEAGDDGDGDLRSEEHTSELQSRENLVCRLLLEKKKTPYAT